MNADDINYTKLLISHQVYFLEWIVYSNKKKLARHAAALELDLELAIESHSRDLSCVNITIESHIHIPYYDKLTDQQFGVMQPNAMPGCQQTKNCKCAYSSQMLLHASMVVFILEVHNIK